MLPFPSPMMGRNFVPAVRPAFDPANKNASITLSGSNEIATASASASDQPLHGLSSKTTGKWYFEIQAAGGVSNSWDFGLGVTSSSLVTTAYIGSGADSWGYAASGNALNSGAAFATYATYIAGDVIGVFYDGGLGRAWWSKNGVIQSGNPFLGTGGVSGIAGTIVPAVSLGNSISAQFVLPTVVPAGYQLWGP